MVRLSAVIALVTLAAAAPTAAPPRVPVTVREAGGVYRVAATFRVPQSAAIARAVLTDYEQIPRFMPDVQTSRVVERGEARAVVEQVAVARVLFFSKRVHLVLDVQEEPSAIRFRDRCGQTFRRYEGAWTLRTEGGEAVITYELTAEPAFDAPGFVLARLLQRDAGRMIERLQAEITRRFP
jgi:ribosome-associated toxin RatA of RatAB toxin-antitoxin module